MPAGASITTLVVREGLMPGLAGVAVAASWIAAKRAARMPPVEALRYE